ncbi:MAG: adenine deaminase [Clostridiales bacterium]|nr:adenine deaminase [Clostridiales bacterium]
MDKQLIDVASGKVKAELVIKDAKYLNVFTGEILRGDIAIEEGIIAGIGDYEGKKTYYTDGLIVPGFIDGHIHIESSMATPEQLSKVALPHGTTTAVCDPHEIVNVAGEYGLKFMLNSGARADIDFKFMLPSCVPATPLDENYKALGSRILTPFYRHNGVIGLAEVMNVNAVLSCNQDIMAKINCAKRSGKIIDGHAPAISGKALNAYVAAGIMSDHECTTYDEALSKLRLGQFIMIRQGTAAHNLKELLPLVDKYPNRCMFVTDDLHPEDLISKGHIDYIIKEAIRLGADKIKAITCATLTPAQYFGLSDRGAIAPGKRADLVVLDDDLNVKDVFTCGKTNRGIKSLWRFTSFNVMPITLSDLQLGESDIIGLVPGQLLTNDLKTAPGVDENNDIVKLFAAERHHGTGHKAACYLKGYGIKQGAVAMSIGHDSHNIIAAGYDEDIVTAVNELISIGGGIVVTDGETTKSLPLEIGGIMSAKPIAELAERLDEIKQFAYTLGINKDIDPFMTLSFLSLPVIPSIRLLPSGVVKL